MKKILTLIFLICSIWSVAQISPAKINRIQSNGTDFGMMIPQGDIVVDMTQNKWFGVMTALKDTASLVYQIIGTNLVELSNFQNNAVQTITTGTFAMDVKSGVNGNLLIQSNTTITFTNYVAGMTGNIDVSNLNTSTLYTITFALGSGGTVRIAPSIRTSAGVVTCSGNQKLDVFSWYWNGTYFQVTGTKDMQ